MGAGVVAGQSIIGGGALDDIHGGSTEDTLRFHEEEEVDSARVHRTMHVAATDVAVEFPQCFRKFRTDALWNIGIGSLCCESISSMF